MPFVRLVRWAVFVTLLAFWPSAVANILLEPYGGGQFSGAYTMPDQHDLDDGSFSGFIYGGRAGFQWGNFSIGGEFLGDRNVDINAEGPNKWGNTTTHLTMSNTNYGAFMAYEFMSPLTIRLIGTFFFSTDAHIKHATSAGVIDTDQDDTGYGYKGEISARLARYLAIGFCYYYMVYTQTKDNLLQQPDSNVPVNTQHAVMAIVSLPMDF